MYVHSAIKDILCSHWAQMVIHSCTRNWLIWGSRQGCRHPCMGVSGPVLSFAWCRTLKCCAHVLAGVSVSGGSSCSGGSGRSWGCSSRRNLGGGEQCWRTQPGPGAGGLRIPLAEWMCLVIDLFSRYMVNTNYI